MMEVPSIKKQITVDVSQERAFLVFTQRLDAWWPREFQIGRASMKSAVLEPKMGSRWYEVGEDGSECDWGKVLIWEPPRRVVLAWQITADFRYDPAFSTEIEVTFTSEGAARTVVDLEHRQLERFGEGAKRAREQMDGGWGGLLQRFAGVAAQPDPALR